MDTQEGIISYEALMQILRDREIDLNHVISIATDGAPCTV